MTADFRALCAELAAELDHNRRCLLDDASLTHPLADRARAALAEQEADGPAVPEGREPAAVTGQLSDADGPSIEDVEELCEEHCFNVEGYESIECLQGLINEAIARWGNPAPAPPADGEAAELVADQPAFASWLAREMPPGTIIGDPYWWAPRIARRAAKLLQRQVMVPVSVSDALIKAECALSDIAEGEPMTDEGDPLQWAERRCADTLAIIRPTMRQHKIRTSEWPPLPLPEVGE